MEDVPIMMKKLLLLVVLVISASSISPAADPFYSNLLNEGKQLYAAGKYDEALEDFKIAEFGLIDEKAVVPELYFYYALTQYRKGDIAECQALLDKMKLALGVADLEKVARPKEIEADLYIMVRALDYLKQPGITTGSLPFFNLFYETWDLLKANQLELAAAKLKVLGRMGGDEKRVRFLEGCLAFLKGDYKRCLKNLEKIEGPLPAEFAEDASFYLAYSYLKRGDLKQGEKWAQQIKEPDHIHRLMELMEEIKAKKTK
jgi:tetratricopeptide (TPR) repeat protein